MSFWRRRFNSVSSGSPSFFHLAFPLISVIICSHFISPGDPAQPPVPPGRSTWAAFPLRALCGILSTQLISVCSIFSILLCNVHPHAPIPSSHLPQQPVICTELLQMRNPWAALNSWYLPLRGLGYLTYDVAHKPIFFLTAVVLIIFTMQLGTWHRIPCLILQRTQVFLVCPFHHCWLTEALVMGTYYNPIDAMHYLFSKYSCGMPTCLERAK